MMRRPGDIVPLENGDGNGDLSATEEHIEITDIDKSLITIIISGGMVQQVYTTLDAVIDVDIMDFDDNGQRSDEERAEMETRLSKVQSVQRHIY